MMQNLEIQSDGLNDQALISQAKQGSYAALETLIKRHQPYIFNIALRMCGNIYDAEDATQEILIKVITKLSTFNGKSSFRTWLYRIVKNHVLNMQRSHREVLFASFETYRHLIDTLPDTDLNEDPADSIIREQLAQETKTQCMMGMLMCLSRQQRFVFVLGGIYNVSSSVGGEIMEISSQNFRKILSRGRVQLRCFMSDKCSLMNKNGTCSCQRKTKAMIAAGHIVPDNLQFSTQYVKKVKDYVAENIHKANIENLQQDSLYQEHPFVSSPDYTIRLRNTITRMSDSWNTIEQ